MSDAVHYTNDLQAKASYCLTAFPDFRQTHTNTY